MKKDTISITLAEYAHLNKAARLVDELQARVIELEAGRNEWFTMYQDLKERTDNYDFLLLKTREQEKEIYHLVKEINKLGG